MSREERFVRLIAAMREVKRTQLIANTTGAEYDRKISNQVFRIQCQITENLTVQDLDLIDAASRQILREATARAYPIA